MGEGLLTPGDGPAPGHASAHPGPGPPRPGGGRAPRPRSARGTASAVLLPVSLALWLAALRDVDLDAMRDLGLLQVLPGIFWAALGLLTLGFCLALSDRRTHRGLLAAHTLGLIAVLHATPTLLYPTLRYSWAWKHLSVTDARLRNGGEVPDAGKLSVYDEWPGFFDLNGLFLRATGLDSGVGYAAWFPAFTNALLLGPLLLLYRSVTRDPRLVWGAVWIFYSCSWVGQDYFAPQAFAFLMFVTVIALVVRRLPTSAAPAPGAAPGPGPGPPEGGLAPPGSAPKRSPAWPPGLLAAVLVVVAAIAASHPLTPLMLVSALALLALPRRNRRVVLPVLAGAVVATVAWDTTVAWSYISTQLGDLVGAVLEPDANIASGLATLGTAAPGQTLLSWVDRILSAAVFVLAAVGFLTRPWTRRTGLPLLVLAPLLLLAVNAYGGEMIFRAYLFALPAAALLVSAALLPPTPGTGAGPSAAADGGPRAPDAPALRTLAVLPVLLAMLGGLVFGYYGKEAVNRFTPDEVAAARFVTDNAPPGSRIVSLTSDVPGLDRLYDRHERVQLAAQDPEDKQRLVRDPLDGVEGYVYGATPTRPAYIVLSRAQTMNCYLTGTLPASLTPRLEAAMAGAEGFTRVWDTADATVFRYVTPPPDSPGGDGR